MKKGAGEASKTGHPKSRILILILLNFCAVFGAWEATHEDLEGPRNLMRIGWTIAGLRDDQGLHMMVGYNYLGRNLNGFYSPMPRLVNYTGFTFIVGSRRIPSSNS